MQLRLDHLPLRNESGDFTVIVETPRGSRNKYKYDSTCHALRLATVLPEGLVFPFDFGFFPSTLGDDGDPLDVLVLLDAPVPAGCIVAARLIGVLEVKQREKTGPWQRNDRFLTVGSQARSYARITRLNELRERLVEELQAFLVHYVSLSGKTLRVLGSSGRRIAHRRLMTGERIWRQMSVP